MRISDWSSDVCSSDLVVLPLLGSSSVRDGTATLGTFAAGVSPVTPVFEIDNVPLRNSIIGLYVVDTRAGLLDADKLVNEVALDRYSFIRDAYIQRRSEEHTSELQSLMRISYAVFCLKKKNCH